MKGGGLVREGRRRAGLTQAELARRVRTTQSAIARLESGRTEPSLERIAQLLQACGLNLNVRLAPADDSDWSVARANLELEVDARLRQNREVLRFAREARTALAVSEARRARA